MAATIEAPTKGVRIMSCITATLITTQTYVPAESGFRSTEWQRMTAELMRYFPRLVHWLDDPYSRALGLSPKDVEVIQRQANPDEIKGEGIAIHVKFEGQAPPRESVLSIDRELRTGLRDWIQDRHLIPSPRYMVEVEWDSPQP